MDIYIKLFEVLFPVFFVVGIGYYLGRKNPKIDTTFITNLAANIGTPAMVIYAVTSTGITFNIFKEYFIYFLIAIILFYFVGLIILYLLRVKDIYAKAISNVGLATKGDTFTDKEKVRALKKIYITFDRELKKTLDVKQYKKLKDMTEQNYRFKRIDKGET